MKRHFDSILLGAVALISIVIVTLVISTYASADEPQIVTINVVPAPTPRPVYRLDDDLPTYKLPKKDVERIARLLWSSPLRSDSAKESLVWLVFNRVDHGAPFGDNVHDVVNASEFTFFDRKARISDKNREIVTRVMNLWKAEKDGYHVGARPPKSALYCRFGGDGNRVISLLEEPSGKAVVW